MLVTSINASLTVNSVSQGSAVTYSPVSLVDGQTYLVQLQVVTVSSYATGVYPATLTITKNSSIGSGTQNYNSSVVVVNDSSSPYGAGWTIAGLQHITGTTGGSTLCDHGRVQDGRGIYSARSAAIIPAAAYDLSSLVYNSGTSTYTRTYPDGTVITFNSGGQETSIADRNGNTTHYTYVTSGGATGALQTITDPVGLVTTLTYSGSSLSTITDPAGAVTTFTCLERQPHLDRRSRRRDHAVRLQRKPRDHERDQPRQRRATVTYDSFGRMSSEQVFGGTGTFSITPAQEVGLVAAGGTTPLVYPSNFTGHHHRRQQRDNVGDLRRAGRHHLRDRRARQHDHDHPKQPGLPTVTVDPLGRTTTIAYDPSGNATTITQADGVEREDPLQRQLRHSDPRRRFRRQRDHLHARQPRQHHPAQRPRRPERELYI